MYLMRDHLNGKKGLTGTNARLDSIVAGKEAGLYCSRAPNQRSQVSARTQNRQNPVSPVCIGALSSETLCV